MSVLPDYLPRAPRYYRVRLDADAARRKQSGAPKVLTYHTFGKLKRGQRVCIKSGVFAEEFGTVVRRARPRDGYSHRVAPARNLKVTTRVPSPLSGDDTEHEFSVTVEVG